jgi:hypothetical protein
MNYVLARLRFWCAMGVCLMAGHAVYAQDRMDTLTVSGTTFSNVTVISRTASHLSFKHAHGFASVKLTALAPTAQTQVGYTPPPPPKTVVDYTADYTKQLTAWINDPRLKLIEKEVRAEVNRVLTEDDKVIIYPVVGGVACIYLLFCLAAIKICKKTTVRPGLWVWLPGFQWISLLKAAGMSPWLFLLLLIPPINLIVMTIWCFRICRMRQKSSVLGFFLLLPVINIFVYFYLAFSAHKKSAILDHRPGKLKLSFQLR